jgi:hypothetical protein
MRKRLIFASIAIGLITSLLALTMTMGVPDPGRVLRIYLGCVGVICCSMAVSWMRMPAGAKLDTRRRPSGSTSGRAAADESGHGHDAVWHPALADIHGYAGRIRLGGGSISDYHRLVRPRLATVASTALARQGVKLDDVEHAEALLGPAYRLVDPRQVRVSNRDERGVDLDELDQLIQALERLS